MRIVVLVLAALIVAAACSSGSDSAAPTDPPVGGTPAASSAEPAAEDSPVTDAETPPPPAPNDRGAESPAADPSGDKPDGRPIADEPTTGEPTAGEPTAGEPTALSPPPPPPNQPTAAELQVPQGFAAYRWADNLFQPTVIGFSPDGRLFIAERFGRVWTVADQDADGIAEQRVLFAEGFAEPVTGLLVIDDQTILVSEAAAIVRLIDSNNDGVADTREAVLPDLPFGLHNSNGMALGPDGRLYFGLGSTCNECAETDPRSATVQAFDLASGTLETIATGLRNPYAVTFTPDGQLWATDNGSDPPCATPDELNRIQPGAHYGWPYCETDPRFESGNDPVFDFDLHSSADGFVWIAGDPYPPAWSNGFLVALFGTGLPDVEQTGKKLQFVQRAPDGSFTPRDFGTGFANPLDVILGPDQAIYVADFGEGAIYRIFPPSNR
jgi:glucose/arabinose dehydrogenase